MKNYIVHMRPKAFLPSFLFVLSGYAASPMKAASPTDLAGDLLLLFLVYSVLLFGGTCCLNTAYDEDEGPLNYLEKPPEKPKHLALFGVVVMLAGVALAALKGTLAAEIAGAAFLLSVAYSYPLPGARWRGKEIGGVDVAIDALGCGVIGVLLGYSATHAPIDGRILAIAVAFTLTICGTYPATQIFQMKPGDTYAEARNFASLLGARRALFLGGFFLLAGLATVTTGTLSTENGAALLASPMRSLFYLCFVGFVVRAIVRAFSWSKTPFVNTTPQFKGLVATMLGARVFWIVAEWMRPG